MTAPLGISQAAEATSFFAINAHPLHQCEKSGLRAFLEQRLEALAGLRPRLISDVATIPGARILDGRFMTVQQAIGSPRAKDAALPYLVEFVRVARTSGFVADLIRKHGVQGLSVA